MAKRKAKPGSKGLEARDCRVESLDGSLGEMRAFVVARINPLRWIQGEYPPLEEVLKTMRDRAAKFKVEKVRPQDLAGAVGPPDEED
ncbi:MAG: hypothetical protein HY236_13110 [Acidobacteria bacterium]|nr:hypothetical protein [Acidobacteriota bacterium]